MVWPKVKHVWLASKNYQTISKNSEIIQRGHIAGMEPRKNISQGWIQDLWNGWIRVD